MHFKETVSIQSLKYKLNQMKNGTMLKFREPTPRPPKTTP